MLFTKRLREGVRSGAITCSVRIWQRPKVTVGKRYRMEEGEIEVDSIEQIALYCQRNRVRGDALEIALRLWTFVHGAASLQIDQDYLVIAPDLDVNRLIADATPGLLGAAPRSRKR